MGVALALGLSRSHAASLPPLARANWIWSQESNALCDVRKTFTLVGRLIRRSGRGHEAVETCLALLGDPLAKPAEDLKAALSTTHPAWGGHPGPENRAAQILSLACRDTAIEPRVRAAFARFRALPEEPISRTLGNPTWTPVRHWTLFYLARALGNLADLPELNKLAADYPEISVRKVLRAACARIGGTEKPESKLAWRNQDH